MKLLLYIPSYFNSFMIENSSDIIWVYFLSLKYKMTYALNMALCRCAKDTDTEWSTVSYSVTDQKIVHKCILFLFWLIMGFAALLTLNFDCAHAFYCIMCAFLKSRRLCLSMLYYISYFIILSSCVVYWSAVGMLNLW